MILRFSKNSDAVFRDMFFDSRFRESVENHDSQILDEKESAENLRIMIVDPTKPIEKPIMRIRVPAICELNLHGFSGSNFASVSLGVEQILEIENHRESSRIIENHDSRVENLRES